jgi:hypothetical protein
MRRRAAALLLIIAVGGCTSGGGPYQGGTPCAGCYSGFGPGHEPPTVPGFQGPWGQPLPMAAPYSANPPSPFKAQAMLNQNMPLNLVASQGQANSGIQQMAYTPGGCPGGVCPPGGCPGGYCPPNPFAPPGGYLAPPGMPAAPGMAPGMPMGPGMPMMPGAGMPTGPMPPMPPVGAMPSPGAMMPPVFPPGAVAAVGALHGTDRPRFPVQRTQVRFVRPSGMKVAWFTTTADGKPGYSENAIEVPGRYNFLQAAIYRLKLTNIEGQPGLEVYPTLEVVPANPRTEEFLAHSYVPVQFTKEDFRQVASGNYLVKVIYLPRREFQDGAILPPGEIVSTQLEPGADPISEALRRGDILLVIRMGGIDQEAPNTPPLGTPGPAPACPPGLALPPQVPAVGMGPGMPPPGRMLPYTLPPAGPTAPGGAAQVPPGPTFHPAATPGTPVSRLPDPATLRQTSSSAVPPPPLSSPFIT